MDRRKFLRASALGTTAAAASATLAAPLYAQGNRTLTMVTSVPDGFPIFDDAAQYFADAITAMSDGQITIDKKPGGTLVGAFEVFDAVAAGQADMYHTADYYFIGQHPAYGFFGLPFGMTAPELANWYYHDGGFELHNELGQIFGIRSFMCGNTGVQAGGWFNKEINSAEDLQGLRFRMPGFGGLTLAKTGASVQNIPGSEIYQALSSGAIDGAEWIGPYADEPLGFQEICELYYTAGFHEPGTSLTGAVNLDIWESLTSAQQAIIENAAIATNHWNYAQAMANNASALERIAAGGTRLMQFPDDVWDAFGAAALEVYEENAGDPIYDQFRESYNTSMRKSQAWASLSEGVFLSQRERIFG